MADKQKTMKAIESALFGVDLNDANEVQDLLNQKLVSLEAMLTIPCGCGGETFRVWADHVQDDYLFACNRLASECRRLSELRGSLCNDRRAEEKRRAP